ncbi:MAG: DUF4038 domain-containing protein [Anaerolineae bacterium]|nr:DUF4038 domain-containing protein [Anaerolineae bacterium]
MDQDQTSCPPLHVWEKLEVTLEAQETYDNPYTEVEVWVDLCGPGFEKRVYGFWDGGDLFRVRVLATAPGEWTWSSGSTPPDAGLSGQQGRFVTVEWTEAEKSENPCRRGFLRATANGHALEYADGMPCFLLGDTWWSTPTFRYPWYDDERARTIGPEMGFKDMVLFRKAQGYNCIAIIAALPAWANDGYPPTIWLDESADIGVRNAWPQWGTDSAKNMHNEGGRPFLFPGRVPGYQDVYPDVDRLNPAYFQYMDRKIDYLNAQGFTPFIEVARRDVSRCWAGYYDWPESYARYVQYVFSRYQANHCILSPIHFDWSKMTVPSREYNEPILLVIDRYGPPPFGTLLSANADASTLLNFGQASWITMHQVGNRRDHNVCWHLTEIYHECDPPRPALNGEPYYAGWPPHIAAPGGSEEDDLSCRAAMYGSLLSGGFAGHIYGADGLWGGDIEPGALTRMWESIEWPSGAQLEHLRTFALSEGCRYRDLVPNADLVYPSRSHEVHTHRGWAFCARTPEKDLFMLYFEAGCPRGTLRGALAGQTYTARWFDPRTGKWIEAGHLTADPRCHIALPEYPSTGDWGLKLVLEGGSG